MKKRPVELVVISDVHLGTYGCHATELLKYLKSIKPQTIVLNGDIIDAWQFSKRYWPKSHMQVVKHITGLIGKGVKVYYVPGNHDEVLRKFVGFKLGTFSIVNKIILPLSGGKAWLFHGDVFDVTMRYSKWLAKLGAVGYDALILINSFVNFCSTRMGRGKISLSKRVKDKVKTAVKFINDFEKVASDIAIEKGYKYVICGHIHQPAMRRIVNDHGETIYLNSGDWIENLTALEYNNKNWKIYHYNEDKLAAKTKIEDDSSTSNYKELFESLLVEFSMVQQAQSSYAKPMKRA
ncbi:MAG TPA: UDP-2,3-diacylglucosamine diphosphatase [Cytophagaceae bacterium]|jgi:UDP-2,3-diacylglucosamine pyrophosphatase LpxH|nr:UDP-2,3-diacylglucosamine diphosphatase [Cytophagaceae bacterium]